MGEIVDYAAEYATVERLSKMLAETNEAYRATEAYAVFGAILCWVMQRSRTPKEYRGVADENARTVKERLERDRIADPPWKVERAPDVAAFDFFKGLRDATAHGDGRKIVPWNENGILVGYIFKVRLWNGRGFGAEVRLRRRDMARLGCGLADIFCEAMKHERDAGDVEREAHAIQEDVA